MKKKLAEDGIRTRASEEIGALNRRLRPTRPPPHYDFERARSVYGSVRQEHRPLTETQKGQDTQGSDVVTAVTPGEG